MNAKLILATGGLQVSLIYFSLLTGPMPFSLDREGLLVSDSWKMDLSAIRLMGLWLAA